VAYPGGIIPISLQMMWQVAEGDEPEVNMVNMKRQQGSTHRYERWMGKINFEWEQKDTSFRASKYEWKLLIDVDMRVNVTKINVYYVWTKLDYLLWTGRVFYWAAVVIYVRFLISV